MEKVRKTLTACIGISMLLLLGFGLVRFPDASIKECPSGYCGKQGQPHTSEDYHLLQLWERVTLICWPIGMCVLIGLNRKDILKRMNTKGWPWVR